ncbi:MAG: aminotransferase DegT [Lysobacterales bacterium]
MPAQLAAVPASDFIPVNDAPVCAAARRHVLEVLDSGWVSSAGPMVGRFERAFAEAVGVRHAVSTASGTTALHLALAALGIGPGDEVIVPDLTMIATVCAVLYTGATPVFVDIDPEIGTLDPVAAAAAITPRTRALLPVHLYGHPADMDPLRALADAHGLKLVEDAAQAHAARHRGRACGALGDVAAFSFYANKLISTGEGGMLTTDDDALAARARSLRNLAHSPQRRFVHDELGFSYRMGALAAALGLGQLEQLERHLAHKQWLAQAYEERLRGLPGLVLPQARPWATHAHWMYAIRLAPQAPLSRDGLAAALRAQGIETRDFFESCARQPMIVQRLGAQPRCPVSEAWAASGLYLPSGLSLTPAQLERVCAAVVDALGG